MSANAQLGHFELDSDELFREVVLTVPLPVDWRLPLDSPAEVHRFRAMDVLLTQRVAAFRALHDLTQGDVALAVGAGSKTAVVEWERGVNVPSGLRRRRLIELLAGKRWGAITNPSLLVRGCRSARRGLFAGCAGRPAR